MHAESMTGVVPRLINDTSGIAEKRVYLISITQYKRTCSHRINTVGKPLIVRGQLDLLPAQVGAGPSLLLFCC